MENELDNKLYNDFLNGNKEAFNLLYDKYKKRIEYFIYNIVHDHQKAEDLTQETFIYVMQNKMKENNNFKYYIYLKAKCLAVSFLNIENRRNEIIKLYLVNDNEQIEKDVLECILNEENKKELIDSINCLDEKYKNAIYLTKIEGLSYIETSKILGETLQNTKQIVHKGKQKLRNILIKKGFEGMNKVARVMIIIVCTATILSGIVCASTVIYNQYIKKQDSANSYELFHNAEGDSDFELKDDMIFEDDVRLHYKVITDIRSFDRYKEKLSQLPEMSETDFNDNFLMLFAQYGYRDAYERDLEISEITSNETTTYITLKQKENPNIESAGYFTFYAIIDKSLLKENIELTIEELDTNLKGLEELQNLPNDYSVEEAIKDGCLVVENCKILSENKNALDELIINSKKGIESSLRVYVKEDLNSYETKVIDIKYQNDIYIFNTRYLAYDSIHTNTGRCLSKFYYAQDNTYRYSYGEMSNYYSNIFLEVFNDDSANIYELLENMTYDEETGLYSRVISNMEDFNMYKEKINDIPEMLEADFDKNCLIVIGSCDIEMVHERDLEISEITSDETATYITLKQKENPNYDKRNLTLYKIVDKSLLNDYIKLNIEQVDMKIDGFESIEDLPSDYSVDDAVKDGCFIADGEVVSSQNPNTIDEFIEKTKNGMELSLRVYLQNSVANKIGIIDIKYKNGIYIWKSRPNLDDSTTYVCSSQYIEKYFIAGLNQYIYTLYNVDASKNENFYIFLFK